MYHKKCLGLVLVFIYLVFAARHALAQNVFNNVTVTSGSSDNTGGSQQPGSEVLGSTPALGVIFEAGSTFEHIGQFYVAQDGIWNASGRGGNTDYFGYAPKGVGSYLPYQGTGIKGASSMNGGKGAGRPSFWNLELNSTGLFPVMAGMYITNSLIFNAHGPGTANVITTPAIRAAESSVNAVVFAPTATITGANETNYINGFASVTDVINPFTLPLGDPTDAVTPYHPLTINKATKGTVTARYLQTLQHPASLGMDVSWVSPVGNWSISAPAGTEVTVDMPALNLLPEEASYLLLAGWNGHEWVNLSKTTMLGGCVTGNCPLTGIIAANITDLAIGLSKIPTSVATLNVWPNPTRGTLYLTVPADKIVDEIRILDQQGRSMLNPLKSASRSDLDVSILPVGSYILEVRTTEGHTLHQRFIRQ